MKNAAPSFRITPRPRSTEPYSRTTARRCIAEAKAMLGTGWAQASGDVQRAVVMGRALNAVINVEGFVASEHAIQYTRDLTREALELLDAETPTCEAVGAAVTP